MSNVNSKTSGTDGYPFFTFMLKRIINRDDGLPYMIRWELLRIGKLFSVKLHKIVASDDVCLHDHPWSFISIILKGGYYEWSLVKSIYDLSKGDKAARTPDGNEVFRKWYGPGSVLYRPASFAHRLELKTKFVPIVVQAANGMYYPTYREQSIPCYTLVFTGSVVRKWGFFTKMGWIYWKDYNKKQHC